MLQVLVVVDHAVGISGPHRNVVGSLNALSRRDDLRVRLLCERIDETEPYAMSGKIDIRLGFNPHRISQGIHHVKKLYQAAHNCQIIYVPSGLKALLWSQLIRPGKRLIAGPNVSHFPFHNKGDSPRKLEVYGLCDLWVEASICRQQIVLRRSGAHPHRVRALHHAIDHQRFSPERRSLKVWEQYGIPTDTLKILYVGRDDEDLVKRKGVKQVIDAIEVIQATSPRWQMFDFIVVGKIEEPRLRRLAALKNVHVLGFKTGDELATIYASSDISVVPSSWENMPFTVLEAMASGLPVITTPVGGIPEQIESNVSGLLIDLVKHGIVYKDNAGTILAEAILTLVEQPELRQRFGENARKRIVEYFCETRLGEELSSIFHEFASK